MRIAILIILLFNSSIVLRSQQTILRNGTLSYDSISRGIITVDLNRLDDSNALSRRFIQKSYFGGFIDNELKNVVISKNDATNYYGSQSDGHLSMTFLNNTSWKNLKVSYSFTNLVRVDYSYDLFELLFFGNTAFGKEIANLSRTSIESYTYQDFSIGLVHENSGSSLSVGIYDVINYTNYSTGNASVLTEYEQIDGIEFASQIQLKTDNYRSEESDKYEGLFSNGYGFGFKGNVNINLSIGKLSMQFEDIGLIKLQNLNFSDTSGIFRFSGFAYNFKDDNLNGFFPSLPDSLKPVSTISNQWKLMPGSLALIYISNLKNKYFGRLKVDYRYNMSYLPSITASINRQFGTNNSVWLSGGLGGFNGYNFGLGVQISIFKHSFLTLGSSQVIGLFDDKSSATNLYLQFIQNL